MYLIHCKNLLESCDSSSITPVLNRWEITVNRALERREREILTAQDVADAKVFSKKPKEMLQKKARVFKTKATA